LPRLLAGQEQTADGAERLALAWLSQQKQLYATAASGYAKAFAAEPRLAEDGHRYDAACAAVRAGCGEGQDATGLGVQERVRLRCQARDWLRADLRAWRRLLEKEQDKVPIRFLCNSSSDKYHVGLIIGGDRRKDHRASAWLQVWLRDPDLTGVRGEQALARLPEDERRDWQQLWADVEETIAKGRGKIIPFDEGTHYRYAAACVAALAGCGQGEDAVQLDEQERARRRQQALNWSREELKICRQELDKSPERDGPAVAQRMQLWLQHWLRDTGFAGVRGPESLARLPAAERQEWQKLWEEVEALRQRAAETAAAASPSRH
jgi:hypothetical protein